MMPTRFALLLVAALVAGCAAPTPSPEGPRTITIAILPTDNAAAIQDKADALERFLEDGMEQRGVAADVRIVVPLTYVGTVEALRFGHADAAMVSAWPAVLASEKAEAEIVLAEMREVFDENHTLTVAPHYYSYYVVMPESPIRNLSDARGKSVAFSSATSTSGYIFPLAKLVEEGFVTVESGKSADAATFFGEVRFAGGYRQAWEALKAGQVDIAVTAGDIPAALYGEVLDGTRVVAEQGPIPSHAVVFSKDFQGTPEAAALEGAFLDLKGEHQPLMRDLVSGIFVEFRKTTTEEHVAPLSEALETTGVRFGETLK